MIIDIRYQGNTRNKMVIAIRYLGNDRNKMLFQGSWLANHNIYSVNGTGRVCASRSYLRLRVYSKNLIAKKSKIAKGYELTRYYIIKGESILDSPFIISLLYLV